MSIDTLPGAPATSPALSPALSPVPSTSAKIPIDVLILIDRLARGSNNSGAGAGAGREKRRFPRRPLVLAAAIVLPNEPARRRWIYTRDANERGVGFITQEPLPVGRAAVFHVTLGDEALAVPCALLRARPLPGGWYEGAALFDAAEPRLGYGWDGCAARAATAGKSAISRDENRESP